jgi:hypothetical protein
VILIATTIYIDFEFVPIFIIIRGIYITITVPTVRVNYKLEYAKRVGKLIFL